MAKDEEKSEKKGKVVFIIEDDLFLVKMYRYDLESEGVEVWTSADGKEALTFLSKEPPNIVLLDLMLPGMSGFDVLATIRKNERWKNVPVIVLTNLAQPQDMERCKAYGIEEYIVKADIKITDVIQKVNRYLQS